MEQDQNRTYEGMFLLDAAQDFEAASEPVRTVLDRYGAELLSIKPWDERKLAYPIDGRKRGLYVLTYFNLDPSRLGEVEHDCQLDERILRALLVRKDGVLQEEIQADTPATVSARKADQERRAREEREKAKQAREQKEAAEAAGSEPPESGSKEPPAEAKQAEGESSGEGEQAEQGEQTSGESGRTPGQEKQ